MRSGNTILSPQTADKVTATLRRDAIATLSAIAAAFVFPVSSHAVSAVSQALLQQNKDLVTKFVDVVWRHGQLGELRTFWTEDCVNHADQARTNTGLGPLRRYHENFGQAFAGFTSPTIEIFQQIAEDDRVVTQMVTRATHSATGKTVSLSTIRIDRIQNGKIAEHWSVADMAGLMQQLQG